MRPKLEKLGTTTNTRSFTCYNVSVPFFEFYWHFHPEYELTLILRGKGHRLVGNSIEPFNNSDLVLLGPNLPHVWVSDEKDTGPCEAIVIQFPEAFIQNLLHFPEWNHLNYLLLNAGRGLAYSNIETEKLKNFTSQMGQIMESRSLSGLIELLCNLTTIDSRPLSPDVIAYHKSTKNSTRMNVVLHFIQMHFLKPITLKNAAASIHLSETAFSKFFIRNMGKPFTTYLNELRVAHASRLLIETDTRSVMWLKHQDLKT